VWHYNKPGGQHHPQFSYIGRHHNQDHTSHGTLPTPQGFDEPSNRGAVAYAHELCASWSLTIVLEAARGREGDDAKCGEAGELARRVGWKHQASDGQGREMQKVAVGAASGELPGQEMRDIATAQSRAGYVVRVGRLEGI